MLVCLFGVALLGCFLCLVFAVSFVVFLLYVVCLVCCICCLDSIAICFSGS